MAIRLLIVEGKAKGQKVCLPVGQFQMEVGRDCHLRLTSRPNSHDHCVLTAVAGSLQVQSLGAIDRTFVNGRRVAGTVKLREGDVLKVGCLAFAVEAEDDGQGKRSAESASASVMALSVAGQGGLVPDSHG